MTIGNECIGGAANCIQITFIGICTHLWENQPNAPVQNPAFGTRIVMPNASDRATVDPINARYGLNPPIERHVATLAFPMSQFISSEGPKVFLPWDGSEGLVVFTLLDGVTVTVANPSPGQIGKEARCLPGLGAWVPDVAPGETATSMNSLQAAGYFDFESGTLNGMSLLSREEAAGIVYSTATDGPARITIKPFDTNIEPTTVTLSGGATQAFILNIPESGVKDNDNDFLLHYLVADAFPPPPWPPTSPILGFACLSNPNGAEMLRLLGSDRFDFGVGCSNSNLP